MRTINIADLNFIVKQKLACVFKTILERIGTINGAQTTECCATVIGNPAILVVRHSAGTASYDFICFFQLRFAKGAFFTDISIHDRVVQKEEFEVLQTGLWRLFEKLYPFRVQKMKRRTPVPMVLPSRHVFRHYRRAAVDNTRKIAEKAEK